MLLEMLPLIARQKEEVPQGVLVVITLPQMRIVSCHRSIHWNYGAFWVYCPISGFFWIYVFIEGTKF
jgi:hypothetical protein